MFQQIHIIVTKLLLWLFYTFKIPIIRIIHKSIPDATSDADNLTSKIYASLKLPKKELRPPNSFRVYV